jgi:hypothetical protein
MYAAFKLIYENHKSHKELIVYHSFHVIYGSI